MTRLMRNIFVSSTLMLSDFIGFTLAIYAAMEILDFVQPYNVLSIPEQPIDNWIKLHYLLAICCISWFSIRLRHYIYRKTYWLELKEILRTLLIFSVFEISIIAFSKLYFSRVLWGLTWMLVIILVPLMRVCTKQLLSKLGLWKRDALIIGCGKNAIDAYKAITSEKNLGFNIVGFINVGSDNSECESIDGVNVLLKDTQWLKEKM